MPHTVVTPDTLRRADVVAWYARNRARSRTLFELLVDEHTYYTQPIGLRHPIVFYDGHLPAFSFNTLVKAALGGPSIDAPLETLFARGIDPDPTATAASAAHHASRWPSHEVVRAFADEADHRVIAALTDAALDVPGHPLLDRAEAVFTILEHEVMHQETLLYMWHRLPLSQKQRPDGYRPRADGRVPASEWIEIPPGRATLGVNRGAIPFGWDNEFAACTEDVAAFSILRHNVTNAEFLEFLEATGNQDSHPLFWEWHGEPASPKRRSSEGGWYWRGMFDLIPLPPAWPVYVSHTQATAFARWRGARLPSEAEFQRAAYGSIGREERPYPWGASAPATSHGVFDFASWDPEPVGTHPAGRSSWGVDDLVGNGWEWTRTPFGPFAGFRPMASYPQYSADFFDGDHFVMKGASPATGRELLRPTFRNWFRPNYPYVYASFRCVREAR